MAEFASEGFELQRFEFGFDFDFDFGFDILLGLVWWLKLTSCRCCCREHESHETERERGYSGEKKCEGDAGRSKRVYFWGVQIRPGGSLKRENLITF